VLKSKNEKNKIIQYKINDSIDRDLMIIKTALLEINNYTCWYCSEKVNIRSFE